MIRISNSDIDSWDINRNQIHSQLRRKKGFGMNLIRLILFGAFLCQNVFCEDLPSPTTVTKDSITVITPIPNTSASKKPKSTHAVVVQLAEPSISPDYNTSPGPVAASSSSSSSRSSTSSASSATSSMSVSSTSSISAAAAANVASTNSEAHADKDKFTEKKSPTFVVVGDNVRNRPSWTAWDVSAEAKNVTTFIPMPMPNTTPLALTEQEKRQNKKKQQEFDKLIAKDKHKHNQKKKNPNPWGSFDGVRKEMFKYGRMLVENFINGVATSAVSNSESPAAAPTKPGTPAKVVQGKVNDVMASASSVAGYTSSAFGHYATPTSSPYPSSLDSIFSGSAPAQAAASSFAPTAPVKNAYSSTATKNKNANAYGYGYEGYGYPGAQAPAPLPSNSGGSYSYFSGDSKSVVNWLTRLIGVSGKTLGEFLREYQVHVLYDLVFTFFKWIFFLYAGLIIP